MTEQERASVISFVIRAAGVNKFYEKNVPEGFAVPSVFFPAPESGDDNDTLSSYAVQYTWFIKCFHKTSEESCALANSVSDALLDNHRLIPLLNEDGSATGKYIRVDSVEVRDTDEGSTQLTLKFTRRPAYSRPEAVKASSVKTNIGGRTNDNE